MKLQVLSVFL